MTRGPGALSDDERVRLANAAEADLVVSLHVDGDDNAACHGVATYYYGTLPVPGRRDRGSVVGERLADLVQREVVARTDLLDCRTHAKTWELLRGTRMPAVRVEVGYLTNAGDAQRLASAEFRDSVAEGIVAAVQRLYLPADADVTTGALRIPALD
jgi:N-acetylmuramoyl-L-alanine amidase